MNKTHRKDLHFTTELPHWLIRKQPARRHAMPAGSGSGLGAAREAMMMEGIMRWARENKYLRPTEVGGVDMTATLFNLHKAVRDAKVEDPQWQGPSIVDTC
jgi:hypothetical protein